MSGGLVVAVSGGRDSVALLHGLLSAFPRQVDRLIVGHVNHRLRGEESEADADFVRQQAQQLGLRYEICTTDISQRVSETGQSVEEAARTDRYELLTELAIRQDCDSVATAHHFHDQAETILHNLMRGTGLRGLQGMQPSRPLNRKVHLVRPLLAMTRFEIQEFVSAAQLSYREDATNDDTDFTRNRIRNQLMPAICRDFNRQFEQRIVSLGTQASETLDCMDELAHRILSESLLEQQPGSCRLQVPVLAEWPLHLVRHALTVLWMRQQWPRQKMTFSHWDRLAQLPLDDSPAKAICLPGGIRATVRNQVLHVLRAPFT